MADVLSQSEIDALLKNIQDDNAEEESNPVEDSENSVDSDSIDFYDFYSPRKFTKEKMKLLRSVFDNYARILTSQINGNFRTMTDITVLEMNEKRYYEYVNAFHENDCMALIELDIEEMGIYATPMMMYVTPGFIVTIISHMLGGGDRIVSVEENYRYSDVERVLYRKILGYIINSLKDGFSNYLDIGFGIRRIEQNPSMSQDVGLDETVVLVTLNIDMAGQAVERIRMCLPGTLLEHIFKIIDNRKHLAKGCERKDRRDVILEHIKDSKLPIIGHLGEARINIQDLETLMVGDVINLNKPKDSAVDIYIDKSRWFTGQLGVYQNNIAIEIQDTVYEIEKKNNKEDRQKAAQKDDLMLEEV